MSAATKYRNRAAELAGQAERSRRCGDHPDARLLLVSAQVFATLALSAALEAATVPGAAEVVPTSSAAPATTLRLIGVAS